MVFEKSKIVSSCVKRRRMKRHVYFSFPVDVIFSILLYLPSDMLYNVMKFVCKEWYEVIKSPIFISLHLEKHSTTNSVLIQHVGTSCGYVVKPRSDGRVIEIEVKNLNWEFLQNARASCNGLIFAMGPIMSYSRCPSYIVNPLTKDYLTLPLYPGLLMKHLFGFGYVATSKVYKVMHLSIHGSKCYILSVGVDKAWRKINAFKQLSYDVRHLIAMSHTRCCVTIKGCMYWLLDSFPHLLRFDMEKESFDEIPVSPPYNFSSPRGSYSYGLFAMPKENSFCLWVLKWKEKYLYEFWMLKDPKNVVSRDGQWEKLLDIYMADYKHYKPDAWIKSMALLVFSGNKDSVVYNVNTQKFHQIKEKRDFVHYTGYHVESLVPLNNLSLVKTPGQPFKARSRVYSKENMSPLFKEFKNEGPNLHNFTL